MLNKRKIIGNFIDLILIILINACIVSPLNLFPSLITTMKILLPIVLIDVLFIVLYLFPTIIKKEKTIGKLIAKKLIKKEESKFTAKEIIIILIVLLIISFI